jgi:NAD-dependent deacetylase
LNPGIAQDIPRDLIEALRDAERVVALTGSGKMLPAATLEAASEAARGCDLFLSIGTSSLVYPAAALPHEALEAGATLVEVNPDKTPLTRRADHVLRGRAGEMLPELLRKAYSHPAC